MRHTDHVYQVEINGEKQKPIMLTDATLNYKKYIQYIKEQRGFDTKVWIKEIETYSWNEIPQMTLRIR